MLQFVYIKYGQHYNSHMLITLSFATHPNQVKSLYRLFQWCNCYLTLTIKITKLCKTLYRAMLANKWYCWTMFTLLHFYDHYWDYGCLTNNEYRQWPLLIIYANKLSSWNYIWQNIPSCQVFDSIFKAIHYQSSIL